MGSYQGSRWIISVFIYFVFLTFFMSLITFAIGGSYITKDSFYEGEGCYPPREIYEPYVYYPVFDTSIDVIRFQNKFIHNPMLFEADLSCEHSIGVRNQEICELIQGCSWEEQITKKWFGLVTIIENETCTGMINYTYYNISTYSSLFRQTPMVELHENSRIGNTEYGSICNHPNVINNRNLCDLFSCQWLDDQLIKDFDVDTIEISSNFVGGLRNTFSSMRDMMTLKFDIGFETPLFNYIFNILIFYVPLLFLAFGVIQIIRS